MRASQEICSDESAANDTDFKAFLPLFLSIISIVNDIAMFIILSLSPMFFSVILSFYSVCFVS